MAVQVATAAVRGTEAVPCTVEAEVGRGLPGIHLIGLPDSAVRESRDREKIPLGAIGGRLPPRRIVVSLTPADGRKEGATPEGNPGFARDRVVNARALQWKRQDGS